MTNLEIIRKRTQSIMSKLFKDPQVTELQDITTGWETQIVAFQLQSRHSDPKPMVIRIYSGASGGEKAEREYNIMLRLNTIGYNVPKVYAFETGFSQLDSPFLVMERIMGGVLWDRLKTGLQNSYQSIFALNAELMARLHALPPYDILPEDTVSETQQRILNLILWQAGKLEENGLLPKFMPLIRWLRENLEKVSEYTPCVIHRDLHPMNILLRLDDSPVVIDWSGSAVGDSREDVCWTALLASTFIDDGLRREFYDLYVKYSGRALVDLPFFEVFVCLRRLSDLAISMVSGSASMGMRHEALEEMKRNSPHYSKVLSVAEKVTGLVLRDLKCFLRV
jgi:aminoglycoside phosphotransferase (APT) family kinase protein